VSTARSPRDGDEVHAFAGPRSLWGARVARAVHRAVLTAARSGHPSDAPAPPSPRTTG
jgi:adenosylcobinamide amidohydrolase